MTALLLAAQLLLGQPDPQTDACVNQVTNLVEKYSPDLAGEAKGQAVYDAAMAIGCGRDPTEPATRASRR
jgi:hypothetical protein